jgi:prevent-host-death family protein
MESVSVAALKSNLSHYLEAVRKGAEIMVTSHRHPVARLVPLERAPAGLNVMPATKPVATLKKIKGVRMKCDPVEYLLEDRRRR